MAALKGGDEVPRYINLERSEEATAVYESPMHTKISSTVIQRLKSCYGLVSRCFEHYEYTVVCYFHKLTGNGGWQS